MRVLTLLLFALLTTTLGCEKDEEIISMARQIRGAWQIDERYRILKSNGEDTTQNRSFSATFFDDNTGKFVSTIPTYFEWAIQTDPDRLMIAQKLNSSDSNALELYFIALYRIRDFSPNEIKMQREEIYQENGIIITEERLWTFSR